MNYAGNFLTTGTMDLYVASPETNGKVPVVLVYQEAFGVNHHIRSVCERLAREGFLAVAPDLFHREGRRIEIPYAERRSIMPYLSKLTNKDILDDTKRAIEFLNELPTADVQNISSIGFCVGGFASALAATAFPLKKMISFYGGGMVKRRDGIGLTPFLDDLKKIQAKCLFFFGGKDSSISHDDIGNLENTLVRAKIPFEVEIFEHSDHGFFCDERKSYNQIDASLAWKKSLAFLRE